MPPNIGKHRPTRRIDAQSTHSGAASGADGSGFTAPPSVPGVPPPGAPTLSTTLVYSAVTPAARIDATWAGLETFDSETYAVQISTSATFATDSEIYTTAPNQNSISIDNRRVNTLYYVRVRTVVGSTPSDWSAVASTTTPLDTTPPAAVTSQAAAFIGTGDLVLTSVNPTSANYKDTEIRIYASSGGTLLATVYDATGRYVWPAAANLAATANVGDPTLYVEWRARSYGNVFSTAVNASATKTAPTAPTVTVDFSGVDAVFTLTPPVGTAFLAFVADTAVAARALPPSGRYVYPFDQNRLDHADTPDPVLAYTFAAVDGLNQNSTATTGTATNAAPSAPTVTLALGQNQIVCSVTSAPAVDFAAYEYVWKRDAVAQLTQVSAQAVNQYAARAGDEGAHSWTCTVRQKDQFAQYSTATVSSAVVMDALTIAYLRALAFYSDDVPNTYTPPGSGTLAALKDGSTSAGGVTYAP